MLSMIGSVSCAGFIKEYSVDNVKYMDTLKHTVFKADDGFHAGTFATAGT